MTHTATVSTVPVWPRMSSAVLYGVCSASMAFANKAVMSSYEFNFPFAIMAIQLAASIAALRLLEVLAGSRGPQLPPYTLERARLFAVPSIFSVLHSSSSLVALSSMNIPMYVALKRTTPAVNLVLACIILKKPFPRGAIIFSVALITFGCLIAGLGDLTFDLGAYTVGGLSVLVQGLYQTHIQKAAEQNLSVTEIFQLNCYNCLPMFALGSIMALEPMKIVHFQHFNDLGFIMCMMTVVLLGSLLNYALFLCTSLNSALTTSFIGVMKSVLQTVVGYFTFGGVPYDPINITGIILNTMGGFFYTYAKWSEHRIFKKNVSKLGLQKDVEDSDILVHRSSREDGVNSVL